MHENCRILEPNEFTLGVQYTQEFGGVCCICITYTRAMYCVVLGKRQGEGYLANYIILVSNFMSPQGS